MSKSLSLLSALMCTLIWGTTFIAQDTGMDKIGPFIFNGTRFFVGFLVLIPFFLIIEKDKFKKIFNKNKKRFLYLSILIGFFLFFGSALQQVSLLYTDVANAAFFTIFYVPMVPIIVFLLFKKKVHWSVWPSVILCVMGGYLLTNFYDASVRTGDLLVIFGAIFWSLHIIFIGELISDFDLPVSVGLIQTFIVSFLSFLVGITYEDFVIENILNEKIEILYSGILSGGFAFVLQIYAQKNISPAPAAIIFSLEGVFATIAAWVLLNQILNINNILGCAFILAGVLLSQLMPAIKKT
jgi:drug/metabolite transporter (DMT)-like permease